jgi:hypothetical protein
MTITNASHQHSKLVLAAHLEARTVTTFPTFIRHFILSGTIIIVAFFTCVLGIASLLHGAIPWSSWSDVHFDMAMIEVSNVKLLSNIDHARLEAEWWITPVLSFVLSALLVSELLSEDRRSVKVPDSPTAWTPTLLVILHALSSPTLYLT